MDHVNSFFDELGQGISDGLNVAKLAKVVKYYPENMKVDVMPFPTEESAMIINVPLATIATKDYLVYYPLKPDDIVVLLFIDYDTDNILLGEDSLETERGHDVSDCVAIGCISLFKEPLSVSDIDSLLIQEKGGKSKIKLNKGEIEIQAPKISLKGFATYKGREIAVKGDADSRGDTLV